MSYTNRDIRQKRQFQKLIMEGFEQRQAKRELIHAAHNQYLKDYRLTHQDTEGLPKLSPLRQRREES